MEWKAEGIETISLVNETERQNKGKSHKFTLWHKQFARLHQPPSCTICTNCKNFPHVLQGKHTKTHKKQTTHTHTQKPHIIATTKKPKVKQKQKPKKKNLGIKIVIS